MRTTPTKVADLLYKRTAQLMGKFDCVEKISGTKILLTNARDERFMVTVTRVK